MKYFKILFFILFAALMGFVAAQEESDHGHHEHDNHDHGKSSVHLSQKHKHGEHKFEYKIKHGKHGYWHGSAYPHGYGGFGA